MTNQKDGTGEFSESTSGEYGSLEILAMAERLKTFCPKDQKTGKIMQAELAEEMDMSQSSLSSILAGRPMAWKNHRKVINWLIKTGRTSDDILWWQTGLRLNPPVSAGGIASNNWNSDILAAVYAPLSAVSFFLDA